MIISQDQDNVGPISGGEVWFPVSLVDDVGVVVGPSLLAGGGDDCSSQDDEECDGDECHAGAGVRVRAS